MGPFKDGRPAILTVPVLAPIRSQHTLKINPTSDCQTQLGTLRPGIRSTSNPETAGTQRCFVPLGVPTRRCWTSAMVRWILPLVSTDPWRAQRGLRCRELGTCEQHHQNSHVEKVDHHGPLHPHTCLVTNDALPLSLHCNPYSQYHKDHPPGQDTTWCLKLPTCLPACVASTGWEMSPVSVLPRMAA